MSSGMRNEKSGADGAVGAVGAEGYDGPSGLGTPDGLAAFTG